MGLNIPLCQFWSGGSKVFGVCICNVKFVFIVKLLYVHTMLLQNKTLTFYDDYSVMFVD